MTSTPHTWLNEERDGGPMGDYRAWLCTTCGACGGSADDDFKVITEADPVTGKKRRRWISVPADPTGPSIVPFLAGPALSLSRDCLESQAIIWSYVTEQIAYLETLGSKGLSPKVPAMMKDALYRAPEKTDVTAFVGILYGVDLRKLNGLRAPTSLDELRVQLTEAGFPPAGC
jgi:hypothetical protein